MQNLHMVRSERPPLLVQVHRKKLSNGMGSIGSRQLTDVGRQHPQPRCLALDAVFGIAADHCSSVACCAPDGAVNGLCVCVARGIVMSPG